MALPDDIATELGRPLSEVEAKQVELWSADMLAQIKARLPRLEDQGLIERVMRSAIVLRITGPGVGVTQTSVAVDDARVDRRYQQGAKSLLTDDLWAELGWADESDIQTVRPHFDQLYGVPWWLT